MDTEYAIYFLLFVLANSYFMYRAGQREGRFEGMVQITRFFKSENALIDKSDKQDLFTLPKSLTGRHYALWKE